MAEITEQVKRKTGRPRKYPEGWRAHRDAERLKRNGPPEIRADGKPKHFRVRRTKKQIIIANKNKVDARNNFQDDSSEFQKLLEGTTLQRNKLPLFRISQYINIKRIEDVIKAIKESPNGLIVHEFFLKAFGSLDVTVVFSFLLYMEHQLGVNKYPDSYFCVIYRHVAQYCGINKSRVSRAISQMRNAGLIDTKRVGVPAKVHYRIDKIVMMELLYEANDPSDYKGQSVLVER